MTAAYNRRKGAQFETDLVKYLREEGFDTERLRLNGVEDEGDVLMRFGTRRFVLEAKATKSYDLAGFVTEAVVERQNYLNHRAIHSKDVNFAVVVKRRQRSIEHAFVVMPLYEWLEQVWAT